MNLKVDRLLVDCASNNKWSNAALFSVIKRVWFASKSNCSASWLTNWELKPPTSYLPRWALNRGNVGGPIENLPEAL